MYNKKLIRQPQVLTGATGSLGAHLLHRLLTSDNVAMVVCLVRGNSHADARRRVADSLATRGLPSLESLQDKSRLFVYAADLAEADLYVQLRLHISPTLMNDSRLAGLWVQRRMQLYRAS